ncbi:transcription corepressor [Coprinopsis marcescibilis]|uniref:Protein HIR n=1 Tax=Coprinopsis marcescibilis TaxID=230819 RepID=A0A5C3LIZ8_COPMA|nr:transcription corepressor [Coprinopsis marcescibilis]
MHFTKPAWVMHKDSSKSDDAKRLSIFSVHVHPDGSRIATGGLDAKVRIWSTKPILNPASEASGRPPKSLSTLTMHTGPVLVVRWAHNGRWLASGSDDEIVMIWDLDPNARGKVWGSDEVNVEGWKPLKRLPGHDSDVTDIAWSPKDRYLASVGLDSKVIIWDGYTLECVRKLEQHQGFVKGVCWDPVGEFLATQSDDKTVKIWRTTDWSLEAEVTKPFEDSPGSTFFRRLSWSPDGAHITASNATNNKGFVFIAAVITRNTWASDISLVGHENTVEVAAYNPHIFLRNPSAPVSTSNICSVVALGADDRSVSIWQTKSARPLIVAKQVFDRQIMDLSWSWDGLTLYASSSDGTIAVFSFTPEELEGIAPHSVQEQYLSKFGFKLEPALTGYDLADANHPTPPPSPSRTVINVPKKIIGGEQVNQLVARRGNLKKRVQLANGSSSAPVSKRATLSQIPAARSFTASSSKLKDFGGLDNSFPSPSEQPFEEPPSRGWGVPMDVDLQIDGLDGDNKGKRKAAFMDDGDDARPKGRTLGGERKVEKPGVVKQLSRWGDASSSTSNERPFASTSHAPLLPSLSLLSYLSSAVEDTDQVLEARNDEAAGTIEVSFVAGKQIQWLDYLPSPVTAVKATHFFSAVATQDGCLNVYSPTGRRLMPSLSLGTPVAFLDGNKHFLLAITITGQVNCWNVKQKKAVFAPASFTPILSTSPNHIVTTVAVSQTGIPLIQVSNGVIYSYDHNLLSFIKVTERWWADHSEAWHGRSRAPQSIRGAMSTTEHGLKGSSDSTLAPDTTPRPEWWNIAITLGHLESRMHAIKLLDSSAEYRQATLVYAKKIADEGFRAKAEELIKELCGPIYWRPGRDENVSSTICGIPRRDLLKEVLSIFARSKTLAKLGQDWQEILKKVNSEDL